MRGNEKIAVLLVVACAYGLAYFFYARPKRLRLIDSFVRDHRVDMPFAPEARVFSGELRARESLWVLGLWILFWLILGVAWTWGAISHALRHDDSSMAWGVVAPTFSIAAIGFGVWWYRRGQEILLPGVKELGFDVDKLTKRMASGEVHEYPFDANLRMIPHLVEEDGFLDVPVRFLVYLEVITPNEEMLVPADFIGLGEFLARARHAGAKVEFAKDGPAWLAEQMQALPSWQPGYFDRPAIVAPAKVELSCQACGGAARYETGLKEYACHYCGSAKLTPTGTFKG